MQRPVQLLLIGCLLLVSCCHLAWGMSRASPYKALKKDLFKKKKKKKTQQPSQVKDPNPDLVQAAARTRRKIKCRDNDIIVVTYPKSGTHWISSVLSQIYYAAFGGHPSAPGAHVLPDIQPSNRFHKFPIYWLLPGTTEDNQVLESSYQRIENTPRNVPRIFLSHMPVEYFEYSPTPRTRIIYMMRDPKAVWASMLNMLSRRIQVGTRYLEGANATEMAVMDTSDFQFNKHDVQTFTRDFLTGGIRFPPRNADTGPMFSWNSHTLNWWNAISNKDPRYGTGTLINYNTVIKDPEKAVADLMLFLNAYAINNASTIAERASYEAVKDAMQDKQSRLKSFAAVVHMPDKRQTTESTKILDMFEHYLSPEQREAFYQSNYAHSLIRENQHPATALAN